MKNDTCVEPFFENMNNGLCIMCNEPIDRAGNITCSEKCHELFIEFAEKKFGVIKRVVDMTTGLTHEVPTRDIIEKGLKQQYLINYPILRHFI